MTPYQAGIRGTSLIVALVCLFGGCALAAAGYTGPKSNGNAQKREEAALRKAFDHFYNLEYDKSVREFEALAEAHADDPRPLNHLLTAVLFRELYRIGALDTELYAKDSFLTSRQFPLDPKERARVKEISDRALALAELRLRQNPNDVEALYCRGVTRGLRSTAAGLLDKAWFAALRSAIGARRDHERVLELDPNYADAKMIVGIHNYVVGSLSWAVKAAASVVGISGSKKKGIQYLYDAANAGGENSADAKIALSLFLRREERYGEAITVVESLFRAYPRNFLYGVELGHLLNAAGKGAEAIVTYRSLLEGANNGRFVEARIEQAAYGLGEALRGQKDFQGAADAYDTVLTCKRADPELQQRAALASGEMYDLLHRRDDAIKKYQAVVAADPNSDHAQTARKLLKHAYHEP